MTDTALYRQWAPYFRTEVRQRGRAYFEQGRVQPLPPGSEEVLRASVQGSRPYTVVITADSARPTASCTCPSHARGIYCKHIWAALLSLNEQGEQAATESENQADGGESPAASPSFTAPPRLPKARKRSSDDPPSQAGAGSPRQTQPEWLRRMALLRISREASEQRTEALLGAPQVYYEIQVEASTVEQALIVALRQRRPTRTGWGRPKPLRLSSATLNELQDPVDRELCGLIVGARRIEEGDAQRPWSTGGSHATFALPHGSQRTLLERMIATGRCVRDDGDPERPLRWDSHPRPWVPWLVGHLRDTQLHLHIELRRDTDVMPLDEPALILPGRGGSGVLIRHTLAVLYDDRGADRWVQLFREDLRRGGHIRPLIVPGHDVDRFIDRLYRLPHLPDLDLPESIARQPETVEPVPHLELRSAGGEGRPAPTFRAENGAAGGSGNSAGQMVQAQVHFTYDGHRVGVEDPGAFLVVDQQTGRARPAADDEASSDTAMAAHEPAAFTAGPATTAPQENDEETSTPGSVRLIRRDHDRERQALQRLGALGLRTATVDDSSTLLLPSRQVPEVVGELLGEGWNVIADRRALRRPRNVRLSVRSGIDWFEVRGKVQYETEQGQQLVDLSHILEAARSGNRMIKLDDGTDGVLPEQWLSEHGLLAAIGQEHEDHLRFGTSQAALLDALLAEEDLEDADEAFLATRERIRQFERIEPAQPGAGFHGQLRHYQEEGLGWLIFLRWFGMGGILADDMGLGKTIQVLALLCKLRNERTEAAAAAAEPHRPLLVVAPRSVVYNWVDEAQRFTPDLRVTNYTGTDRAAQRRQFNEYDLVTTSYGLLRRDAAHMREYEFDTVVLDEAQAIKNPASQGAKAARLLKARHRLALTGTPVENHLGDLWSIFEFLNPGMLGTGSRFAEMVRGGGNDINSVDAARQAGRALRPFILRRTKTQVLDELPEKTEQTLLCEMEPAQRQLYESLRKHYRGTLLKQVDAGASVTSGGSTMLVLEALLRLRQAACHPGLVDQQRRADPAAKLDVLLTQLEELADEGHKALVFSQFTSLLALVREALDKRGMAYEYLDGQTRDRREPVKRFQQDADCPVFLISLKAGGLGLNLTAADYVFILDPWWNPAVEQQAIDRAHRIGQMRHVTAYRLICENTVEQRIIELQQHKRELAEAIVEGEQSLLRSLTRDDLDKLLS